MSVPQLRILGLMFVSAWVAAGCSGAKKIDVGGACILNSDCNQPLVCTMGKCHDACHTSADCPKGETCMKTDNATFCQLPAEADCSKALSCSSGFVCASDQHCRTPCQSRTNCTAEQMCVSGVCAAPAELDPNDQLPQKGPATDGGVDGWASATGGADGGSSSGGASGSYGSDAAGAGGTGGAGGASAGTGGTRPDASGTTPNTGGTADAGATQSTGGTTAAGGSGSGGNTASAGGGAGAGGRSGGASGVGGTTSVGGVTASGGTGGAACTNTGSDEARLGCVTHVATGSPGLIDDLSDGNGSILQNDGRQGTWYTTNDGTGTPTPVPFLPTGGQACTSGSGFTGWGALIALSLNQQGPGGCPYDASVYSGIMFRLSGTLQSASLRLNVNTVDDNYGTNDYYTGTCRCTSSCDAFGSDLLPTPTPQRVILYFSDLRQGGWGTPATWNPRQMTHLQWVVSLFRDKDGNPVGPASFSDLCIDDVEFF